MTTNTHTFALQSRIAALPPVLDVRALEANFNIGRTTAYHLASSGEIQSLTMGAPGKRGKRAFLTQSVLDYVQRRLGESTPLNCPARRPALPSKQKTRHRHNR